MNIISLPIFYNSMKKMLSNWNSQENVNSQRNSVMSMEDRGETIDSCSFHFSSHRPMKHEENMWFNNSEWMKELKKAFILLKLRAEIKWKRQQSNGQMCGFFHVWDLFHFSIFLWKMYFDLSHSIDIKYYMLFHVLSV